MCRILVGSALVGILLGASLPVQAGVFNSEKVNLADNATIQIQADFDYSQIDSSYQHQTKFTDRDVYLGFILGRNREEFENHVRRGIEVFREQYEVLPDSLPLTFDFDTEQEQFAGKWDWAIPGRITFGLFQIQGWHNYNIEALVIHELTHREQELRGVFPTIVRYHTLLREGKTEAESKEILNQEEGLLAQYDLEMQKREQQPVANEIDFYESLLKEEHLSSQGRGCILFMLQDAKLRQ